jgi:hypothetical protein
MTPLAQAFGVYLAHPTKRTFANDLAEHLKHGYVLGTPTGLVLGRPVPRDTDPQLIVTPEVSFDTKDCDCWHIWLGVGDWHSILLDHLPYHLPWMSWERRFILRFHRTEKVLAFARRVSLPPGYGQRWIRRSYRRAEEEQAAGEPLQHAVAEDFRGSVQADPQAAAGAVR